MPKPITRRCRGVGQLRTKVAARTLDARFGGTLTTKVGVRLISDREGGWETGDRIIVTEGRECYISS
jgi:hypothetical protein